MWGIISMTYDELKSLIKYDALFNEKLDRRRKYQSLFAFHFYSLFKHSLYYIIHFKSRNRLKPINISSKYYPLSIIIINC